MPLRCLLFSSNEEMCQPIWQVLADLGIEGEYCASAVDAVERVTTQMFQIVVADWDDQPEAAFLLKTAKELKAAHRPLMLAIVGDDSRLPEALKAGANSVLLKPIRPEQARDTLGTACELLRSRQFPAVAKSVPPNPELSNPVTSAKSSAAAGAAPALAPISKVPESSFRAGEFLQSAAPAPGAEFDIAGPSLTDQAPATEPGALIELERMATEAAEAPEPEPQKTALTGWASLQERLGKATPLKSAESSERGELQTNGQMSAYSPQEIVPAESKPVDRSVGQSKPVQSKKSQGEAEHEAALFAYMERNSPRPATAEETAPPRRSKISLLVFAVACVIVAAVPQTRNSAQAFYRNAARSGKIWLNPQPAPVPQVATQHETFGQEGDEFKLPSSADNSNATTDSSQIRVVPVIDPTAKPNKGADGAPDAGTATDRTAASSNPEPQAADSAAKETAASSAVASPAANSNIGSPSAATPAPVLPPALQTPPAATQQASEPVHVPPPVAPQVRTPAPTHTVPANSVAIPSSLRSQIASMTPDASGAKPVEAAMSSIEPVNVPESTAWDLLTQKTDPLYPDSAKASGQHGSVALQVLVGRDGAVQDAKFLQGSFLFARAAIDAVKQWHFKPYVLNGRPVTIQTVITVNFKPSA
jgi:periplasmic protein TonB